MPTWKNVSHNLSLWQVCCQIRWSMRTFVRKLRTVMNKTHTDEIGWAIGARPDTATLPSVQSQQHGHMLSTTTTTTTTVLRLFGFCPGQPGWASTRRNIHPLTPIVVIKYPYLLPPSTTIHDILPIQSMCFTVFIHNLSPSFLWSTSWPGTLHSILHTFFTQ